MKIDILTLFPSMFTGPFDTSIIKHAREKNLVDLNILDLRKWGEGERHTVDDRPYGGGIGMIIRVDIVDNALNDLKKENSKVILLDPKGQKYTQSKAKELSRLDHVILIAGHYEGFDYRIQEHLVDEVISIGDYVLTGGEIPAMVLTDSITRLIPGVLEADATHKESFTENLLEHPHYTRPVEYKGWKVPKVLSSGNHAEIEKWKKDESQKLTKKIRPDLT
jgi:tRNA (guanine37-N1)-methyltransferase